MAIDFSVLSRGITCTPNYHGSIRNTVVQHINDNIERYQDFTIDPNIYISKMFKQGTWVEKLKFRHLRKFTVWMCMFMS